ncbi:MAG TPA: CopG family transcriptional regulator [Myxococcales bacterium]|jgi:hypothetical protein|nr:CopG family transcriptional regulator [Myxococcales bacterium]
MKRTQIYLSDDEAGTLRRKARESGRTVSDLIREAIDRTYLSDPRAVLGVLDATAGAWSGRDLDGASYVDSVRPGRLAARHAKRRRR